MNEQVKRDLQNAARSLPPSVDYGWGREHLRVQLAGSGIDEDALERFDGHATALIRLHIAGIISDGERNRAASRLTKAIQHEFRRSARKAGLVPSPPPALEAASESIR